MKLKIVSDGTSNGTKIVDAETGEEVRGVTRIEWTMASCNHAEATVHFEQLALDAEGLAEQVQMEDKLADALNELANLRTDIAGLICKD